MGPVPPRSVSRAAVMLLAAAVTAVTLAGCGTPPDYPGPPDRPLPLPTTPATATPTPTPTATATPSAPAADRAVDCNGRPDADAVLAVLRRAQLLDGDEKVTVVTGPLCAEDWQYTIVSVPDRDPLHVVTRGAPGSLQLVTAGTDVCTIEVRVRAPSGIRTAASCVG